MGEYSRTIHGGGWCWLIARKVNQYRITTLSGKPFQRVKLETIAQVHIILPAVIGGGAWAQDRRVFLEAMTSYSGRRLAVFLLHKPARHFT